MKGKFRRLLIVLGLIIVVPGWLILTGVTFFCSLGFSCNSDASGWWSLFLTAVALPIVVFQLYTLRTTIEESIWKPKVDVGLILYSPNNSDTSCASLSKAQKMNLSPMQDLVIMLDKNPEILRIREAQIRDLFFPVRLVVRNDGKKALRFMKLSISLEAHPDNMLPGFAIKGFQISPDNKTLIFRGGSDHLIYPGDFEQHQLILGPDPGISYLLQLEQVLSGNSNQPPDISGYFVPGDYKFRCVIWAEGLDEPVNQVLLLTVIDDRNVGDSHIPSSFANIGKERSETGSSKYGFETDEDRKRKQHEVDEKARKLEEQRRAREIATENLAKELNPVIQDILRDYLSAQGRSSWIIRWDEKTTWETEPVDQILDKRSIGITLKADESKPYFEVKEYDQDRYGRRVRNALPNLKRVLEEVTNLSPKVRGTGVTPPETELGE